MARFDTSFNFGANAKPKQTKGKKAKKARGASNAWTVYVTVKRRK